MLEGEVDDEVKLRSLTDKISESPTYTARGLVQGCIIHLGPSYSDTVSSFEAEERWKASFGRYYDKSADLSRLRNQDESYTARLVEMTDTDVAKICGFKSAKFFGISGRNAVLHDLDWLTDKPCVKRDNSVLKRLRAIANTTPLEKQHNPQEPRRFLGSDYFMASRLLRRN